MAPELTNKVPLELTAPVNGYAVDVWATGATLLMISISMNPFAVNQSDLTEILRRAKAAQAGRGGATYRDRC